MWNTISRKSKIKSDSIRTLQLTFTLQHRALQQSWNPLIISWRNKLDSWQFGIRFYIYRIEPADAPGGKPSNERPKSACSSSRPRCLLRDQHGTKSWCKQGDMFSWCFKSPDISEELDYELGNTTKMPVTKQPKTLEVPRSVNYHFCTEWNYKKYSLSAPTQKITLKSQKEWKIETVSSNGAEDNRRICSNSNTQIFTHLQYCVRQ